MYIPERLVVYILTQFRYDLSNVMCREANSRGDG